MRSWSRTLSSLRVFDRHVKQLQRDSTASLDSGSRSRTVDYLRQNVAESLLERLLDIKRTYNSILDLAAGPGHFSRLLDPQITKKSLMFDLSSRLLHRDDDSEFEVSVERRQVDEEHLLKAVEPNSQDAVVSCLGLHWVNDLPGVMIQVREALKPDGFFLGALFGGETLFELRSALQLAEVEREGGISPHVSPMTQTQDVSNLLGRAGFTLLTVDSEDLNVGYPSIWELMDDLRDMGEGNAVIGRRHVIHRDTLLAASAIYQALHGKEDGSIAATFQILYFIGWKPDATQPKPLPRGSGQTNLKDVL